MAQYYTDFSEFAAGAGLPSGWTNRWSGSASWGVVSDGAATGSRFLRAALSSNVLALASWDAIDADADRATFEILARVRTSNDSTGTNANRLGVAARASGDDSTATGYVAGLGVTSNVQRTRLFRYGGGTFAPITEATAAFAAGTWYWVKYQATGTTHRVKRWAGAIGDEPGAWEIDTTNSANTAAGWIGAFAFLGSSATHDFDVFAVGTGGDAAPSSAPAGGLAAGTLSIDGQTHDTVDLSWTEATGGTGPYSYQVRRAPDVAGDPGTFVDIGSPQSGTTYQDTGLSAETKYHWEVVVTDDESATDSTNVVTTTTDAAPIPELLPGTIEFVSSGPGGITVNSATAASGGVGAIPYQWERSEDSTADEDYAALSGKTSADMGLDATATTVGVAYRYRRVASDEASQEATSNVVGPIYVYEGGAISGGGGGVSLIGGGLIQ